MNGHLFVVAIGTVDKSVVFPNDTIPKFFRYWKPIEVYARGAEGSPGYVDRRSFGDYCETNISIRTQLFERWIALYPLDKLLSSE